MPSANATIVGLIRIAALSLVNILSAAQPRPRFAGLRAHVVNAISETEEQTLQAKASGIAVRSLHCITASVA